MKEIIKLFAVLCLTILIPVLTGCEDTKTNNNKAKAIEISLSSDAKEYGIKLSEKEDFSSISDSYIVDEFKTRNTTFSFINFKGAFNASGLMDGSNDFLAYTLYIKNEGSDVATIELSLKAIQDTKNMGKAVRIAVIDGGNTTDDGKNTFNNGALYLKNDGHGDENLVGDLNDETIKSLYDRFEKEFFKDDSNIGSFQIENVGVNDIKKITIIIWLEGSDIDCTNEILGGIFSTGIDVSIKK